MSKSVADDTGYLCVFAGINKQYTGNQNLWQNYNNV